MNELKMGMIYVAMIVIFVLFAIWDLTHPPKK